MSEHLTATFRDEGHDHARCVADALVAATAVCKRQGLRLTPVRRRVFELVWRSHRPIRAYDILAELHGEDGPAAPPTVYRALDFLLTHGLVHRIDSLNAFAGCAYPGAAHKAYFLICTGCDTIAELDDPALGRALARSASRARFDVEKETVEIAGLCHDCRTRD